MAVAGPEGLLLPDRLQALPARVREAVRLGAHRGTARALALVQLKFGVDPWEVSLEFPAAISPQSQRARIQSMARTAADIVAEVDVDEVLQRGADPALDGA